MPGSGYPVATPERGLTLVEVLVAAAILVVALIPLSSALGYGFRGVNSGQRAAVGNALLECAAERAKEAPFGSLNPTGGAWETVSCEPAADPAGYALERRVTEIWDGEGRKVELRVTRDGRLLGSTTLLIHRKGRF